MLANPKAPTIPNGKQHANADSAAKIAAAGAALSTAFTNFLHDCATNQFERWNSASVRATDVRATTQAKTPCSTRPQFDIGTINANAGRADESNRLGFVLSADFNLMNLVLTAY
jgi:hypothetical protein